MEKPRVLRYDPSAEPLMRFLLRTREGGPDLAALAVSAREDLLPRFEGRPAIASAYCAAATKWRFASPSTISPCKPLDWKPRMSAMPFQRRR